MLCYRTFKIKEMDLSDAIGSIIAAATDKIVSKSNPPIENTIVLDPNNELFQTMIDEWDKQALELKISPTMCRLFTTDVCEPAIDKHVSIKDDCVNIGIGESIWFEPSVCGVTIAKGTDGTRLYL